MARIKIALPVTGIRGVVGGLIFSFGKGGPFCYAYKKPSNPQTPKQMEQRSYLRMMGYKWRTLSTAEQADWDTFAASPPEIDYNPLGDPYDLSGFGWFTRICTRRMRTGQVEDLLAPTSTPTAAPITFGLTLYPAQGDADRAVFSYTSDDFLTYYAILQLSLAPGLGSNVQTSRYLNCWEALQIGATETEFGVSYYGTFGGTQVGQRFFFRLYRQSPSGIRSTPSELFTDVIAYP